MPKPAPTPIRTKRSGTFASFERRYQPVDPQLNENFRDIPTDLDIRLLWTVVDEDGVLYICPGRRFVNRFGFIIATIPWDDQEEKNTPYVY